MCRTRIITHQRCPRPPNTRKLKALSPRIFAIAAILLLAIWFAVVVTWRSSKRVPSVNAALTNQLAVLPLHPKDATDENTAFDNGLIETLTSRLTQLGKNHPLQVVPASEVRSKGIANLQEAREQFGATLGLQLNVERSGQLVRVNYALIDAKSHRQLAGISDHSGIGRHFHTRRQGGRQHRQVT